MYKNDHYYMKLALENAKKAAYLGEVPVGAILIKDDVILASSYNQKETQQNPLRHAELIAIEEAVSKTGTTHLPETILYVTLEPCAMCAGGIIAARIPRVVIGAMSPLMGAAGSIINLFHTSFSHSPALTIGVCEEECSHLMSKFFERRRTEK